MTIRTHKFSAKRATALILLAGSLASVPAFGQEIIRWVDEEGVTHFGHPATAKQKVMQEQPEGDVEVSLVEDTSTTTIAADVTTSNQTKQQRTQKL